MVFLNRLSELTRRAGMFFSSRKRFDRELEEEMRLHRELRTEELREQGIDAEEASYAAARKFGNTLRVQEEVHQAWGWSWIYGLGRDLRYAARGLRRSPGFAFVAIATLALGIGANTAIFTLIQQVLFNSLPVSHPEELYSLGDNKHACCWGGLQDDFSVYSLPLYEYLRDHTPEFSDLAGFMAGAVTLGVRREGDGAAAQFFRGEFVSGNYFRVLGLKAAAGRLLEPADDHRKAAPAVVMSYRAWQTKFGGERSLVGRRLVIRGIPFTLAGITPAGFYGDTLASDPPDFWMPLSAEPLLNPGQASLLEHWNEYWLYAIGRLKPGVDPRSVQAHATTELQQWLKENYVGDRYSADPYIADRYTKDIPKQHINVIAAAGGVAAAREKNGKSLRLLMLITFMVLLIACANIANLLLVRSVARRAQIALRLALGASRAHIVRHTMSEGILMALLGGALGVIVSMAATDGILLLAFRHSVYVPIRSTPSLPVLLFAFALSVVTGIVFSTAPAWIASRAEPAQPMRSVARSTFDRSELPQRSMLVLQAAASLVLLASAGLLSSSLHHLQSQSFGINTEGRLVGWIDISRNQFPPARLEALYRNIEQALKQMPGVVSASFGNGSPMSGGSMTEPLSIAGKPPLPTLEYGKWPRENRVGAHYFETVGTRLVRGRAIDERDTPATQHVAVVDEAFARLFLPGEDPIGQHFGIQTAAHSHDYEIVGMTEDAQYDDPKYPHAPTFFLPLLQTERYEDTAEDLEQVDSAYVNAVVVHVSGKPQGFVEPLRKALSQIDPNVTLVRVNTLEDQVARNFDQERLVARLTSVYAMLALVLATVGLYGVASYLTASRTNEIGIRMALGADRVNVVAMIVRSALTPIAAGLALGVPLAIAVGQLLSHQLYGVKSYDPMILAGAVLVMSLCALIAGFIPARRAASIDPVKALRAE